MGRYFKVIAENRKARFDFHVLETYQVGITLKGTEVKSVRLGKVNLKDSFARVEKGEVWAYGIHISPYAQASRYNVDPLRVRKLLMGRQEISRLIGRVQEKGLTLIPLKIYLKGNWVKIDLALAKAKKLYDKRRALKKKMVEREVGKALAEKQRKVS